MKQLSGTVLRNSVAGIAAQLAIKVLSFVFTVVIVRRLGPEVYGQYTGALAFGAVFTNLSDLGLANFAVRQVARWRDLPDALVRSNRLYGNVLALRFLLAVATAALLVATAWATGQPAVVVGAIALGTIGLLLYSAQGASEAMIYGLERMDLLGGARVLNQIVFVALGALALWWGAGFYGLIFANIAAVALLTWICWQVCRRLKLRPSRPDWRTWWPLLRASLPFAVIAFALGLSYKFDSVLLSYRSQEETGLYNSVYNLVFAAVVLSNSFNLALYPSLTREVSARPERLPGVCARAFRYLMVLSLPIAAGTWALADQIVPFLFGARYEAAAPALAIIIWVVPFMFASEFLGYVVLIADKERAVARAILVSTGVNVLVNSLLVPRYGFLAASAITVLTEMVLVGQYLWLLGDLLRGLDWGRILVRPALAAALMSVLVLLLRARVPWFLSASAGAVAYGALLLGLGVLGREELRFARGLRWARE